MDAKRKKNHNIFFWSYRFLVRFRVTFFNGQRYSTLMLMLLVHMTFNLVDLFLFVRMSANTHSCHLVDDHLNYYKRTKFADLGQQNSKSLQLVDNVKLLSWWWLKAKRRFSIYILILSGTTLISIFI